MVKKNKIFALIASTTIGIASAIFSPYSNVHTVKPPLKKILKLTIVSPHDSYRLVLKQQDCQMAAKLIRENLQSDLNTLSQFNRQIISTMSSIQNQEILPSSKNCLRLILTSIGGLPPKDANKIIENSFVHTSYAKFNNFVYQLLEVFELL